MRTRSMVAALAVAALLTACGGDESGNDESADGGDDFAQQSGEEIADAAREAMLGLDAVHLTAELTLEGTPITMDLQLSSDGKCNGSLGAGDQGTVELLAVDGERWYRGDEAFWAGSPVDPAEVAGKWVADTEGEFEEQCSLEDFVADLFTEDEEDEAFTVRGTEELDGEEVVVVEQDDPEEGVSTGYVQTGGEHYLVKIAKEDGADTGELTFSEFDEEFEVTAPAEDEVVELPPTA